MKNRKWVLGLALMVMMAVSAFAQKYDAESDFVVKESGDGVIITAYQGKKKKISIPPKIQGKPVIGIYGSNEQEAIGVFQNKGITSITIPDSVISIGRRAFRENKLTSFVIPNSVTTIGDAAFMENQLTSVTIPDSVTTIGNSAFSRNSLTSVVIPDSVTSIGNSAFSRNSLTSVVIPNSVITIEAYAFTKNKLTRVTIPDSITTIGNDAFSENELTGVTIPSSVTTIRPNTFAFNQITSITIPDSVTSIGENAFRKNQLAIIVIPDSVITIGNNAFDDNLLSGIVTVARGTSIGDKAFGRASVTRHLSQADIAERQRQEEEKQRQEEEKQRQEAERLRALQQALQQRKEQILRMVRLDGTYINTRTQTAGHGGILPNQHVYAIRFCDKLLNIEELESIRAIVIYDTGREVVANFYECFLEGSNIYYADKNLSLLYTSTNNRNSLQARTASGNAVNFEFKPHSPVAGKTYRQFSDTRNTYSFESQKFTSQNIDSRLAIRGTGVLKYTYEYSGGVATLKVQSGDDSTIFNYLYISGPFLTVGQSGSLYVEESMLKGW
jgi:hypothetical protein